MADEFPFGRDSVFQGADGGVFLMQPGVRNRPRYQDELDKLMKYIADADTGLSRGPTLIRHCGAKGEKLTNAQQDTRMQLHLDAANLAWAIVHGRPAEPPTHRVEIVHDEGCTRSQLTQGWCGRCVCEKPVVRLVAQ